MYVDHVLALEPVAYWRLGESSGTVAADASGNGHNGTYVGAPTLGVAGLLTGDSDTAVTFDGVDDRISVAAWPNIESAFSIVAWVKRGAAATYQSIVSKGTGSYYLRLTDAGRLNLLKSRVADVVTSAAVVPATGAHMVAATYDGTTVRLYIDGVADGSAAATFVATIATVLAIGADQDTNALGHSEFHNGTIDEPAVWNRALTATEIADLYREGVAPTNRPIVTVTLAGTDITADVAAPSGAAAIVYGRGANFDGSSESPGYATVMLKNANYAYNPDNTGSARYALLKVGKVLRITAVYSAVTYYLYHGYVRRIVPNPITKFAEIVTQDALFNFSRREASVAGSVTRNLKAFRDAILDDIAEAAGSRSLALGNGPENEVPFTGADQVNVLGVLDEINAATSSYHYIAASATDYTYTTKDRLSLESGAVVESWSDTDTANPFALDISGWDYTDEKVNNSQRVYASPRLLQDVDTVVWSRPWSLTVDASTTVTRWPKYDEPTFNQVLSYTMVGTGATVTFTPFARSGKVVITAGATAVTLNDLKITGARAPVTDLHSVLSEDASSITSYGRLRGGDILTDYLSSTAQATGLAQWLTYRYAKPRSFPTVRFENRFPTQLVREIGNRVTLVASRLSVNQDMYLRSFETAISDGGAVWTTDYEVEEASALLNLFTLDGTADQGLGGTAVLGL